MTIILLKLIHMIALVMAGGGVIGGGLLMRQLMKNPGPPPPMVGQLMKALGMAGLAAIILLWLSGLWLAYAKFGTLALGGWFYLKLAGAALVLVTVLAMTWFRIRAEKSSTPPDMQMMKRLAMAGRAGLGLALLGAVIQFR